MTQKNSNVLHVYLHIQYSMCIIIYLHLTKNLFTENMIEVLTGSTPVRSLLKLIFAWIFA